MRSLPLPSADESSLQRLVDTARGGGPWPPEEVARLAVHLAESGDRLTWPTKPDTADVASTGGPGSLSTLLAPLALRALGCRVVKLAVPGRPAGAIDALGTIPGYRVQLTSQEATQIVAVCGFVHFLADKRFAPLDAELFRFRQRVDAVNIPTLAAASLLSKKIAVGVTRVGLDVRVGAHGNFGATDVEARANGWLFCAAARLVGIHATAFLGSSRPVAQPWIGRGESLVALALSTGLLDPYDNNTQWLSLHARRCCEMAATTAEASTGALGGAIPSVAGLRDALTAHLAAQGATLDAFRARVDAVARSPLQPIDATGNGTLEIDLAVLRDSIVELQRNGDSSASFTDPCGIRLLKEPRARVTSGEQLALLRCGTTDLAARVRAAFRIADAPSGPTDEESAEMEVIRA
jgi:thymidine phosphorylase